MLVGAEQNVCDENNVAFPKERKPGLHWRKELGNKEEIPLVI